MACIYVLFYHPCHEILTYFYFSYLCFHSYLTIFVTGISGKWSQNLKE